MSIYSRNVKAVLSVFFFFLAVSIFSIRVSEVFASDVEPSSINVTGNSDVCLGNSQKFSVSITLPTTSINEKVDVFLLFDDTGSFADFIPTVRSIFSNLVSTLEATVPGIDFGFGVGRFEDYGGPGTGFSLDDATARPFILSQPIITATDAGGDLERDTLISAALLRTAPGFGGDKPEAAIAEGLYQIATGIGFDGDGNGNTSGSGPAGASSTQISPGTSGDVPAFSSNVAPTSGTLGGVGWRSDALHLVILATDVCTIAAFPTGTTFPTTITGVGGSEPHTTFTCSTDTGTDRFGFVSNSKTSEDNTVIDAVVPTGAGTVQNTIDALNALGIRVIGMGPEAAPTNAAGPSFDESVVLSSLARLTGAIDDSGNPLVFSTSVSLSDLSTSIVDAISTIVTLPVDISLKTSTLPLGLSFDFTPPIVTTALGETASFMVKLTGDGTSISGPFNINFLDINSFSVLGKIPSTISCDDPTVVTLVSLTATSTLRAAHIKWETATEIDNIGFNVWRSEGATGRYTKINNSILVSQGDAFRGANYSYHDTNVVPGRTYRYQLEDVEIDGTSALHGPVSVTVKKKFNKLNGSF